MKNYVEINAMGAVCLYINGGGMRRFASVSGCVQYLRDNFIEAYWL